LAKHEGEAAMTTYIVFVTFKQDGPSGSYRGVRYIDSQWASCSHAQERKAELSNSLNMFHVKDWSVDILTGQIADAGIDVGKDATNRTANTPECGSGN
jgi:hypothetical protein